MAEWPMVFHPERTAIVGATGPTGLHLARELVGRGRGVRVVSRRRDHLEQVFADHRSRFQSLPRPGYPSLIRNTRNNARLYWGFRRFATRNTKAPVPG